MREYIVVKENLLAFLDFLVFKNQIIRICTGTAKWSEVVSIAENHFKVAYHENLIQVINKDEKTEYGYYQSYVLTYKGLWVKYLLENVDNL